MDTSVIQCVLAGVVVCLGGVWLLWIIPWLLRIELAASAAGHVARLGLQWEREGLAPRVRAVGAWEGEPLELALRWTPAGPVLALRHGARRLEGAEAESALAGMG